MMARKGVTQQLAKIDMRRRLSLIGTMMLHKGEVDGLICGTWSTPDVHLNYVDQVIGNRKGVSTYACMNGLLLPDRQVFLVDTHINYDPTAEQLCEITIMAAEEMRRFGLHPKAALLSHSNFGTSNHASALKMRETLALLKEGAVDGLSIGFRVKTARKSAGGGIRRLLEVDLWEISIVTFPMLPQARITSVKQRAAFH
jgi:malate dehydrogenase (oxaloacetate-decarboxylating)(NADP+)